MMKTKKNGRFALKSFSSSISFTGSRTAIVSFLELASEVELTDSASSRYVSWYTETLSPVIPCPVSFENTSVSFKNVSVSFEKVSVSFENVSVSFEKVALISQISQNNALHQFGDLAEPRTRVFLPHCLESALSTVAPGGMNL